MDYFQKFADECQKFSGKKVQLSVPPKGIDADLALPCFSLGKNPAETAKKLGAGKIPKGSLIKEVRPSGPYVNFYIDEKKISRLVLKDVMTKKGNYGKGSRKEEKILLEHTSVNPSGPIHIGRLRNSVIGDTLGRILKFYGYSVKIHFYVNDMGKQIAIILWGTKNNCSAGKEMTEKYKKYINNDDFRTMFTYVKAYEEVSEEEKKMSQVSEILQKAETGDKKFLTELKKISEKCLKGQVRSLKRVGIEFDEFDFESTFVMNHDVDGVMEKLKIYLKKQDGATGLDLSSFGLERRKGILVLKRSDGTSVYILRDIAYHLEKTKKADWIINVLGEDHKVEFNELKTILKDLLKVKNKIDVVHYAFVTFEGLQLSTRKGITAPLDMLIDEGIEKAKKYSKDVAEQVTTAAVRYHLISYDLQKQVRFVWDEALNFEGNTGPYLQYSYARAKSIIKKSGKSPKIGELGKSELPLIKKISMFPRIVEKSAKDMKPHYIAFYCYELSSLFNEYYHSEKVIGSESEGERLALVSAAAEVMKICMKLLGIPVLERM